MKYILRSLVLPFHVCIIIIFMMGQLIKTSYLFIRFGGELITYDNKCNSKTLMDVFNKIQNIATTNITNKSTKEEVK